MDSLSHSSSTTPATTANTIPPTAHYLAEIKYPRIADSIALDKILSVLQKIRDTSKPISYKWTLIDRPKDGELFLEQKFPITRDAVNGDQFPIVDDGYLWSSIPKPEIREVQGQTIEIYRWCEGYAPGDPYFTVTKLEYRLKVPGNILFLIHYLTVKNPCVPIRPALPASKISPVYLQQQFHSSGVVGNTKVPQLKLSINSASGNVNVNASASTSVNTNINTTHLQPPKQPSIIPPTSTSPSDSLDLFDAFSLYDASAYRLSLTKSFLSLVFLDSPASLKPLTPPMTPLKMNPGLAEDLTRAMQKKTESIEERIRRHEGEHATSVKNLLEEREEFLKRCERIKSGVIED